MSTRRYLIAGAALALGAVALVALAAAWLLATPSGLAWSLATLTRATHGAYTAEGVTGTWWRGVSATRMHYRSADASIVARNVQLRLDLARVLGGALDIAALRCERLTVDLAAGGQGASPASLALPFRVDVDRARIAEASLTRDGRTVRLRGIAFAYAGGKRAHRLRAFRASADFGSITADGTLAAYAPFDLGFTVKASLTRPLPLSLQAGVTGTLSHVDIHATLASRSAKAAVNGIIAPFAPAVLAAARASWQDVDLHDFDPALPATRIAGRLDLTAAGGRLIGPLHMTNGLAGPLDAHRLPVVGMSARVDTDFASARFDALRIDLGAGGQLTGTATASREQGVLRLTAHGLDLRALQRSLGETHLEGDLALTLAPRRQVVAAHLTEQAVQLVFEAERRDSAVEVSRFTARSHGGLLTGTAHLSLSGTRAYRADATVSRFDPSAWGNFPHGSINGRVDVSGALGQARAAVHFVLHGSRLRGLPLAGQGRFDYARQRVTAAEVRLALGRNTLAAHGALGGANDRLHIAVDAPHLAGLDPRLAGALNGTGEIAGRWPALAAARVRLRGRGLAYAGRIRIGTLAVQAQYQAATDAPLLLSLRAGDVETPAGRRIDVTLDARGTEHAHTLALRVRGKDIDVTLRAQGGWSPARGWRGLIERLTSGGAFPGSVQGPVPLAVSAQHMQVGPFAAELMGGQLAVSALRYENGRFESSGRFARMPVGPLLALAGRPAAAGATLRLSGSWSVRSAPGLAIAFSVMRDSGDLTLAEGHGLPLGLQTLQLTGHSTAAGLTLQATVKSALVSGTAEGTIASTVSTPGMQIGAGSALHLSARLQLARLSALAPLLPGAAHVDGRVELALEVGGTLGAPRLSGAIDARELALVLPPQGVDLSGGTLQGRLADGVLDIERFSIHGGSGTLTAHGTLGLAAGSRAAIDWRAEHLTLLGRPDRRLIVSGSGRAALEQDKLAFTGALRADSGVFEFGKSELPTLGPDVVIAGHPHAAAEEPALLSRAAVNLELDLGEHLHIRAQGFDAWITGRVLLHTAADGRLLAKGDVRTQRGTYTAYGQQLQVKQGQLTFDGPLDNPGLNIVAMRTNQPVEAGVAVTGTLRVPLVSIVSNPAVSENEALSWLILGRAPADASRADLATLPLAAAALFGHSALPQDALAHALGVDSIGFSGGTLGGQVVTVGKRVFKNLYVIYEQSLGAAANVLKIELDLTRRIVLRAETGETSSAGVFYRYAFD